LTEIMDHGSGGAKLAHCLRERVNKGWTLEI
jgi:hypothetical protein